MAEIDFKIRDVYTNTLVRVSKTDDLKAWLREKYVTLTDEQDRCISGLCDALESGEDPTWWGAACGLVLEPHKKTRRKR